MKISCLLWAALAVVSVAFASCTKDIAESDGLAVMPGTRAAGDKSPVIAAYVDVEQTNPLNAGLYRIGDKPFIDIVMLNGKKADNLVYHSKVYLSKDMTSVLENADTYVRPLQSGGTKVLLSISAESDHGGYEWFTEERAEIFTDILTYIVDKYNLDGIDFYEQMGNGATDNPVENSFSYIITKLRAKFDAKFPGVYKLITLMDMNSPRTLTAEAVAALDYAWSWTWGNTYYNTSPSIPDLPDGKWSPMAVRLDINTSASAVYNNARRAIRQGMGALMMKNLTIHTESDPLSVFTAVGSAAMNENLSWGGTVTRDSTSTGYEKTWTPAAEEMVISYEETVVPEPEIPDDPELENQTPLDSTKFVMAVSVGYPVNPLNAGAYKLPDGSPFFDIVTVGDAYFMEMTDCKPDVVGGYCNYNQIKPLQDMGIKVLMSIRSGYGRWGFANLTDELIDELSDQIKQKVIEYKYNGVELLDMDATYDSADEPRPNTTSYSKMILALREKLSDRRVITMRHIGYSGTLSQEAVDALDRVWTFVSSGGYSSNSSVPGLPNRKWAPMRIPLGFQRTPSMLMRIGDDTWQALNDGMGAIAFHQLDTVDVSKTFTAVAAEIYGEGTTVSRAAVYTE